MDLRVSEKGCVSLYGLRRFPISLYADEWEKVLNAADEIRSFIAANASRLPRKGQSVTHTHEDAPKYHPSYSQMMGWNR